jgi:hypothetical protein
MHGAFAQPWVAHRYIFALFLRPAPATKTQSTSGLSAHPPVEPHRTSEILTSIIRGDDFRSTSDKSNMQRLAYIAGKWLLQ